MKSAPVSAGVASLFLFNSFALAQAQLPPVVSPRGVINAFTQQPAPSAAAPGGIVWINGLNLGPAEGARAAEGASWPTELGGIQVLVNMRPAPLGSVTPGRIVAQIPYETPAGLANIVVQRGEQRSRPARINILPNLPSIRAAGDRGFGQALTPAGAVALTVSGLGIPEPPVANGEASAPDAQPRGVINVYVGGLPAKASFAHAANPGEFTVTVEMPAGAKAGDAFRFVQAGRPANAVTLGSQRGSEVLYVPLPAGAPELRDVNSAGLRGTLLGLSAARSADGCYPAWIADLSGGSIAPVGECLVTAVPQASSPFVEANEGAALAALVGPAAGDAQTGISAKLRVYTAADPAAPLDASLPGAASVVGASGDGNFVALIPGQPARTVSIDSASGEVREAQGGGAIQIGGGGGGAAGAIPIGGGAGGAGLVIDLGDGLNRNLTGAQGAGMNTRVLVVGDNTDNPTRAKVAFINPQNAVQRTLDFPAGWLPLAAPAQPLPPGIQPPPGFNANRISVTAQVDGPSQAYLVLARREDSSSHGLIAFPVTPNAPPTAVVEFPAGWFAAACTPGIRFFGVELARRIGLLASNQPDREFRNPCPATGFLLYELDARTAAAIELPGAGQFSATGGTNETNDYIYGANANPAQQNVADTLYVLDGVTASAFRIDLPAGVTAFTQLQPVPGTGLITGLGRVGQVNGDGGFVVFDLDRGQGAVLPVPEGFANIQALGAFPATRKLLARGNRTGGTGSQFLVYDLTTGDLEVVPNPEGVAFVGAPPAQGPGGPGGGGGGGGAPGQQQAPQVTFRANPRAHTVAAITYNSERRQNGVVVIRLP